jgi:hypothetical protein
MGLLTRDQILGANDLKVETVEVPEWGGSVQVRTLTGKDRDAFVESLPTNPDGTTDPKNYRSALLAFTIVDENGELLFSEEDVNALGNKSATAIMRVFAVANKLNGISASAVKEEEKNSDAAQSGASTSDSASS